MTSDIKDPNIFRCANKKVVSVLPKHILYASYIICALAVITLGYFAITNALYPFVILPLISAIVYYAVIVYGLLSAIAWYWYAIAAIPCAYYGYGLLRCMARDLEDEDWQSKEANSFALVLALALFIVIVALVLALALFIVIVALALALSIVIVALAFALSIVIVALALALSIVIEPVSRITIWYYVFRFFGAYRHYLKRKKMVNK